MRAKTIDRLMGYDRGSMEILDLDFILNSIPGAVVVYKLDPNIVDVLYCSRGIKQLSGWDADEFIGNALKTPQFYINTQDRMRVRHAVRDAISMRSDLEIMYRMHKKNDSLGWVWMQGHVISEEDGCVILEAILLDITRNTNMYQNILDEATAMMTVIDAETYEILYANKSAIDATKDKPGEYIGSICYAYIAGLDSPCAHCPMISAHAKTYDKREVDYGSRTYCQLFEFIEWNGRKALLEYSEDITEQKQNLRYAKEKQDMFGNILNNIPAGILVFKINEDGFSIIEANVAVCNMMGIDRNKTIGAANHNIIQLTHPDDVQIVMDVAKRLSKPHTEVHYEYRNFNREKNAYVWVSGDGRSVLQPDGTVHAYISFTDITEQRKVKELEDKLTASRNAAEAKAEFYSRMSHDMRTPMNGILGITELALKENDIENLHLDIEKIEQSGKYMLSLINDTLDLQRIETGRMKLEPQVVYYREVLDDTVSMIRSTIENKGIEFQVDNVTSDLEFYVRVDRVRLKQIIVNLLSNAAKFTPEGGKILFSIRELSRNDNISHDMITVSDTGIGMSTSFLESGIFEPFSQEQNDMTMNYPGSGLGLSIVKSLVELMGGRIDVESEIGNGTTFRIYVDIEMVLGEEVNQINSVKSQKTAVSISSLKGRKILLCEDHPLNAEIAKRLLQRVECEVDWACDGQKGAQMFAESQQGTYDAVLMDIRMPVMDGLQTAAAIRKAAHPDALDIPIIAMSANAYVQDVQKSMEVGMNAHLTKPIDAQEMYDTLARFI